MSNLNVHVTSGIPAPHKAILLLAICDLIESNIIIANEIRMTDDLKKHFENRWNKHIPQSSSYSCSVWTPYWHMGNEDIWEFIPLDGISDETIRNLAQGHTASIGKMKEHIKYAKIDDGLFKLLCNRDSREIIKETLINTWTQC